MGDIYTCIHLVQRSEVLADTDIRLTVETQPGSVINCFTAFNLCDMYFFYLSGNFWWNDPIVTDASRLTVSILVGYPG